MLMNRLINKILFYLALFIGKAAIHLLRITGRGGTSLPGKLAMAVCLKFSEFSAQNTE